MGKASPEGVRVLVMLLVGAVRLFSVEGGGVGARLYPGHPQSLRREMGLLGFF